MGVPWTVILTALSWTDHEGGGHCCIEGARRRVGLAGRSSRPTSWSIRPVRWLIRPEFCTSAPTVIGSIAQCNSAFGSDSQLVEPQGQCTGAVTVVAIPAVTVTVAIPGVHPPSEVITV